ncbi:MAG: class I poly(R)-hydroxyalkanoic acid synthase [Burkholderiales bacterium]|jgi:polyhydroxyalkanoate synthase|nr:class I poly(R)-hydroxyalkanoic acid synthase [Burkholderiales bacterium]MBP7521019.1 class I poly(R)-hydroxyalkanoic acid synthase [Leptothrix sp. (in: b-proteobacteria)]HQY08544.1 class I poly(R)-hydroxyalkanoic acid synthase [Burkholderiaceae bacterium]
MQATNFAPWGIPGLMGAGAGASPFNLPGLPDTGKLGQQVSALGSSLGPALQAFADLKIAPTELARIQAEYLRQAAGLWNSSLSAGAGSAELKGDRRFSSDAWASNPMAGFAAANYLLNARTLMELAEAVQGDEKTKARVRFAVQQWIDAAAPSNFLALNADAQKKALDTKGESLSQGMALLVKDLQQGHVSQTDESVFEVGRNVATTEGAVVFENELFQLIEYKPLTDKVYDKPMLFVPPCINKFYIMDLQPENSLIRYTVEQGHRLFVVSWRNVDESLAGKSWDDYIEDAVIRAVRVVQEISGSPTMNTLGFCVGGTLLATALAVLAARGEQPAASLTMLTSFLDFSATGVLDLFVDETSVRLREMSIGADAPGGPGLLKGKELATTFSFLRPNDLVWNYVVGNYLKGEAPPPFDLLYWNSDGTNLPGPMYCWYLRHTYLEDKLKVPGALTVCGEKVNLGAIECPAFVYASREDHIVPWDSAYLNTRILKGPLRYVLGASGHIAGVINPPAKKKRNYWKNDDLSGSAQQWLEGATSVPGSWWTEWTDWLNPNGGKLKAAPKSFGNRSHKAIEPAPGRYVKQKAG